MKVSRVRVKKYVEDLRDLTKKRVPGLAYKLSDNKLVYQRELVYYGLKKFDSGIDVLLFTIGFESLLCRQTFSLPRSISFNKFVRRLSKYLYKLKELGIVQTEKVDTPFSPFYRWVNITTHTSASDFQKIKERLDELESEYAVDTNYLRYEGINYEEIKSGRLLLSDEDIDKLEKFFGGEVIVARFKSVRTFDKLLHSTCEKILEGWKENERIVQFVEEKNVNLSSKFKARIKPPKNLLEESYLTCDQTVVSLIEPLSMEEIEVRLGYRSDGIRSDIHILNSYGIIEKIGRKYVLKSLHPFEIASSKLSKRMERYRKYVKTVELYESGEPLTKISSLLNTPYNVVCEWISMISKPYPISNYTAELLLKRGVISQEELESFKLHGLIY